MCEEEDLYFLYLDRLEQARKAARGEASPPNPAWLWPNAAPAPTAAPGPTASAASAAATPRVAKQNFVCDTPDE